MPYPHIIHHGAINGVTGSCHQLHMDAQSSLLIDCGIFQGNDSAADERARKIDFSIQGINALIVTHVHADHIGRIPYLLVSKNKRGDDADEPSADNDAQPPAAQPHKSDRACHTLLTMRHSATLPTAFAPIRHSMRWPC